VLWWLASDPIYSHFTQCSVQRLVKSCLVIGQYQRIDNGGALSRVGIAVMHFAGWDWMLGGIMYLYSIDALRWQIVSSHSAQSNPLLSTPKGLQFAGSQEDGA